MISADGAHSYNSLTRTANENFITIPTTQRLSAILTDSNLEA